MHGLAASKSIDADYLPNSVLSIASVLPDALAVSDGEITITFGQLARNSAALAGQLRAAGVHPGGLIGLLLPRGIARTTATLAAWRIGAAPLLLDPDWPDLRIKQLIEAADVGLLVGDMSMASRDLGGSPRFVPAAIMEPPSDPSPEVTGGGDDLAYVVATSGSTGRPKLVEITHRNLAALAAWHRTAFAVTPGDRATHLAGVGFDAAMWEVWPNLAAGASVHVAPERVRGDAQRLRDWLGETGATIAFAPTIMAERLMRLNWPKGDLRLLLTGGDRLGSNPPPGLPFTLVNNYGPAECTVVASSGTVPAGAAPSPPSIGKPILGCDIRIVDRNGRPVQGDEIGEIWIGGETVGRGYRGMPDQTAAAFVSDPTGVAAAARFYRTGDLGSWRTDGSIDFHGRADDQVQIRGHRVEPGEVAATLASHPQVLAAAAIGVAQADGPALVAYVETAADKVPGADELRAFLGDRLPDWAVPAQFVRLERMPMTAHGKLDRDALPAPDDRNRLPASPLAAPTNPTEERLLTIMCECTGGQAIGIDDNFFLLGGHSLLGTQVVLRASQRFGVDLTLRHLFQAPTVRGLARVVHGLVEELVASLSEEEVLQRAHG